MTETVHLLNLLDYREVESTAERLVLEMDNRPDLANVRGALQGGLVATLIDIAAGMLAGSATGAGHDVTTADLNIHFLAPIMGTARAEATMVRAGKRLIVTAVDVTDTSRDRLAARATLTFAVLTPR
ncbi:PaaI family thioesterase [Mycolicibacterium bacteremicum]|uniref:Phenylacetic acid degradation protein n=1 Tax=Mycolicibacterium bacteremicum TaxID=564198 RepID=A0A1W9YPQ1_MYCBA|nr:PaaI family thioesterase [Mycolicibacterium bacteremicum]MCV7434437.1 PaaI family thioesterase [Mycolicibacterium bacteremicum]ORA02048.1 phenylacetic acid degradation protein [Mycolicibacterium bacteremicum]